jgi:hypothetical protein
MSVSPIAIDASFGLDLDPSPVEDRTRGSAGGDFRKRFTLVRRSVPRDKAQRALVALAQPICTECGSSLDNGACLECGLCHCPFCAAEASTGCCHLLATAGDVGDADEAPFSGGSTASLLIRSPFSPRPTLCLPDSTAGNADWGNAQKRSALGRFSPVLVAWEAHRGLWREPNDALLLEELANVARLRVRHVQVDADSAPNPEFADCWFCLDVAAMAARLDAMLPLLAERLERLSFVQPRGKTPPNGLRCRSCDLPLGDSTRCATCQTGHCPFCGVGARCWTHAEVGAFLELEECAHLVAAAEDWGQEWRVDPFAEFDLPSLPESTPCVEWNDEELHEAFGSLTTLLDAYDGDLTAQPDTQRFFEAWIEDASIPVASVGWTDGHMCETRGDDYYARSPESFRRAIRRVVRGLERGFRSLDKRSRARTRRASNTRRTSDAN